MRMFDDLHRYDRYVNRANLDKIIYDSAYRIMSWTQFEVNDKVTRQVISQNMFTVLRQLQATRDIYDYAVICDGSNNTPEIIDDHKIRMDVYIKDTRAVKFKCYRIDFPEMDDLGPR